MSIFRRLFSADFRAAVAAEASGDLDLAAERYALAGQLEAAVRVHLARADRAGTRSLEVEALRDALHWAPDDSEWQQRASRRLGRAILARVKAEGIATDRDRQRIREAARHLEVAGDFSGAGEAYASIGDDTLAANSFRLGGQVERLETVLTRQLESGGKERSLRESFADYEVAYQGGQRDRAVELIRRCVELAENKNEYRRLLDDLESRIIAGGCVALLQRRGKRIVLAGNETITLGRDPLCELVLRSAGVSRQHCQLVRSPKGFQLRDAGSRNGTTLGGLAIAGSVELTGTGQFALGTDCNIHYKTDDLQSTLWVESGLDAGVVLVALPPGQSAGLAAHGLNLDLEFQNGRPWLTSFEGTLSLNGQPFANGQIQLIRGDVLVSNSQEVDVQ